MQELVETIKNMKVLELVELKNQADGLAYQVERQLKELGDKVPVQEKARCEQLINDIRQLLKEESPDPNRLRSLVNDLQQAAYSVSTAAYQQATQATGTYGADSSKKEEQKGGDDVIDAEYEEKK